MMNATQREINRMLGISDEVFVKHNSSTTGESEKVRAKFDLGKASPTETQLVINRMLGISEETWRKYNTSKTQEAGEDRTVTIIQRPGTPLL